MNLQQAKKILDKINALYQNLSIDEGNISAIERDLMLNYTRSLYEAFLGIEPDTAQTPSRVKSTPAKKAAPPKEAAAAPPPVRKAYSPPKIIEIPDSLKDLEKGGSPAPSYTPPPPKKKKQPVKAAPPKESADISSLLEHKEATELSEKLSERPVNDLAKALAINDRLLYANELFNKSQDRLNKALENLNQFRNLEEAKVLLSELAEQYDWLDKEKVPVAKNFIKLIRRRYK